MAFLTARFILKLILAWPGAVTSDFDELSRVELTGKCISGTPF
jgi:hypothetical protein